MWMQLNMIALGDITERALTSVGITKDRVQALTGKKDCGCRKRQEAMNAWGYRWQDRLFAPYLYAMYRIEMTSHWLRHSRFGYAYRHFREGIRVLLTGRN
jgi:hypothetical protein